MVSWRFSAGKVDDVRASTAGQPPPSVYDAAHSTLSSFHLCTEPEVRRLIMKSLIKSCSLDLLPTFLLREQIDSLLPFITRMINASLRHGRLPDTQKQAIVTPLLKKPGLDVNDMANYRPVSNLTFPLKVIERIVAQQLNDYLAANNLLIANQSAYKRFQSTETTILRVLSDALMSADAQKVTLLSLLDLSAAFDCVDHPLLLLRLQRNFGLTDQALRWLTSSLQNTTNCVPYAGLVSATHSVFFSVPQGSVLGPLLFNLYTADIHLLVAAHGLVLHQYADECQIYIATPVNGTSSAVDRLTRCLNDVNAWLSASRLRLNPEKTQILWLGSKHLVSDIAVTQVPVQVLSLTVADSARDLGVVIDSCLTMADHVSAICRSDHFQLRQLRPVARSLTADAAKTIMHAFYYYYYY